MIIYLVGYVGGNYTNYTTARYLGNWTKMLHLLCNILKWTVNLSFGKKTNNWIGIRSDRISIHRRYPLSVPFPKYQPQIIQLMVNNNNNNKVKEGRVRSSEVK